VRPLSSSGGEFRGGSQRPASSGGGRRAFGESFILPAPALFGWPDAAIRHGGRQKARNQNEVRRRAPLSQYADSEHSTPSEPMLTEVGYPSAESVPGTCKVREYLSNRPGGRWRPTCFSNSRD